MPLPFLGQVRRFGRAILRFMAAKGTNSLRSSTICFMFLSCPCPSRDLSSASELLLSGIERFFDILNKFLQASDVPALDSSGRCREFQLPTFRGSKLSCACHELKILPHGTYPPRRISHASWRSSIRQAKVTKYHAAPMGSEGRPTYKWTLVHGSSELHRFFALAKSHPRYGTP